MKSLAALLFLGVLFLFTLLGLTGQGDVQEGILRRADPLLKDDRTRVAIDQHYLDLYLESTDGSDISDVAKRLGKALPAARIHTLSLPPAPAETTTTEPVVAAAYEPLPDLAVRLANPPPSPGPDPGETADAPETTTADPSTEIATIAFPPADPEPDQPPAPTPDPGPAKTEASPPPPLASLTINPRGSDLVVTGIVGTEAESSALLRAAQGPDKARVIVNELAITEGVDGTIATRLAPFVPGFFKDAQKGELEFADGTLQLWGIVPDLLTRQRLGIEATGFLGEEFEVINNLALKPGLVEIVPR